MSTKSPVVNNIRIIPKETLALNRKLGSAGEVYYDQNANTLRLFDGRSTGGFGLAKASLENVSTADFLAKAETAGLAGTNGGFELQFAADDSTARIVTSGNLVQFSGGTGIATSSTADGEIVITNTQSSFSTVAVSGSSNVVADTPSDTLTLVAGTNVSIVTDASTDTITISAAVGASTNSFATIAVSGQPNVVADSTTDTLTLVAGTGITISTDATTDSLTITNSGSTTFNSLSDAVSATLTIDEIYLPAITMLVVTNSGSAAYRFDQYGSANNPSLYALTGTTIAFKLSMAGTHPFVIQDAVGTNYDTGLIHVSTAGVVSTGSSAQGKTSGTLYWKVPDGIAGTYRYQCSIHSVMVGAIIVKSFGTI